ncbi:MAG TPA: hypothetical protein VF898_11170 [Chloroflexota bacterium]
MAKVLENRDDVEIPTTQLVHIKVANIHRPVLMATCSKGPKCIRAARHARLEGRERALAIPNPYTGAHTLVERGLVDRREGSRARAGKSLDATRAIVQRFGAWNDVERAQQALKILR